MSMSDPIADFLTRVRNSLHANKRWVDVPSSKLNKRIKKPNFIIVMLSTQMSNFI